MLLKLALSVGLLTAVGVGTSLAQTTTAPDVRNPTLGDVGAKPPPRHRRMRHPVVADKPGPGSTTGNAPDRAAAGGGGR